MPQYLLSVHSVEGETSPPMSESEMAAFMERVGALEADLRTADAFVFGGRLHDSDTATVVRSRNGEVVTTDGPFAESKEHLGGFYIIEAGDLDEALRWATRTSEAVGRPIEVRPFWQPPGA